MGDVYIPRLRFVAERLRALADKEGEYIQRFAIDVDAAADEIERLRRNEALPSPATIPESLTVTDGPTKEDCARRGDQEAFVPLARPIPIRLAALLESERVADIARILESGSNRRLTLAVRSVTDGEIHDLQRGIADLRAEIAAIREAVK